MIIITKPRIESLDILRGVEMVITKKLSCFYQTENKDFFAVKYPFLKHQNN